MAAPSIAASRIVMPSVREIGMSRQTFVNVPDWNSNVTVSATSTPPFAARTTTSKRCAL